MRRPGDDPLEGFNSRTTKLLREHDKSVKRHEYLAAALDDPNPLRANLGATMRDLMDLAQQLKAGVDGAVAEGRQLLDDQLAPALNAYLRFARQIQSFAQLDLRLADL